MELTYFGHASFLLKAGDGTTILTDPFDAKVGYAMPDVSPTAVTASHEHSDHNNVAAVRGKPKVIRGLSGGGKDWAEVDERVGGVRMTTIPTFHDPTKGSQRGRNAIFIYEVDDMRVVHVGDLGHTLDADQVKAVGRPDVLMIPVGGYYTIGPKEADAVIAALKPRVVIPMHYKTAASADFGPITGLDDFTKGKARVSRKECTITLRRETLPAESEVWVLAYA